MIPTLKRPKTAKRVWSTFTSLQHDIHSHLQLTRWRNNRGYMFRSFPVTFCKPLRKNRLIQDFLIWVKKGAQYNWMLNELKNSHRHINRTFRFARSFPTPILEYIWHVLYTKNVRLCSGFLVDVSDETTVRYHDLHVGADVLDDVTSSRKWKVVCPLPTEWFMSDGQSR